MCRERHNNVAKQTCINKGRDKKMRDDANRQGGFTGDFELGKRPALLVIDFQRGMTDSSVSKLGSDCTRAIQATNELIEVARGVGPVIFTACSYHSHAQDAGAFLTKCPDLALLTHGSPGTRLDPRLNFDPAVDTLLYKTQASAFFGTPLAGMLAASQRDTVLVAGVSTSGCVRASVVDALQYGFPPFVVEECVTDRSAAQHRSNLIDMGDKYATLITLEIIKTKLVEMKHELQHEN